jgi:DNA-binding NtrC family response regulator
MIKTPNQTQQFSGKRLLIVEDDINSLPISSLESLKKSGLEIVILDNPYRAEEYISNKTPYDLAIIDLRLPGGRMHQGESIARLSREINPNTPIIMVSCYGGITKPEEADRFFCKLGERDKKNLIQSITNFLTRVG